MVDKTQDGQWTIKPGSGGLVTALGPVLRDRGGQWIGWLGSNLQGSLDDDSLEELLDQGSRETGYSLTPVELNEEEIKNYYFGFSNEILWPLFHDLHTRCNFDPAYWEVYEQVNCKFAQVVAAHTSEEEDYVWVHDYQLILVAACLKKMGQRRRTGFFLHIPFPPLDGFVRLPWRFQILDALLQYDLIGFQTVRDRRNFIDCVRMLMPQSRIAGQGHIVHCLLPEREVLVGEINGRFTEVGWTPIQYIYRSLSRVELLSYYRTCEIALITPLKDGMNLVAKEFCACSIENNGVLILSEFAGAAAQLQNGALLVNPYDIRGVADAIYLASTMDGATRQARMEKMRRSIQKNDIFRWVNGFLRAGVHKDLNQFPKAELYVPKPIRTAV